MKKWLLSISSLSSANPRHLSYKGDHPFYFVHPSSYWRSLLTPRSHGIPWLLLLKQLYGLKTHSSIMRFLDWMLVGDEARPTAQNNSSESWAFSGLMDPCSTLKLLRDIHSPFGSLLWAFPWFRSEFIHLHTREGGGKKVSVLVATTYLYALADWRSSSWTSLLALPWVLQCEYWLNPWFILRDVELVCICRPNDWEWREVHISTLESLRWVIICNFLLETQFFVLSFLLSWFL